ncbi:MAG: hypothetical protein HYX96_01655, partial [Chloroflexi bacterium]|nr:hypothetical protein [Chloroflexota bacterium]
REPRGELCGEVTADLKGRDIVVVGEVVEVSPLLTRDHRPFISARLEDITGRIEVMVWPKTFEGSREMWTEGNILKVEGKVKLRREDSEVQVSCERACLYRPPEPAAAEPPAPPPETPIERRRLILCLRQSPDEARDRLFLNDLVDILKSYPGPDEVYLHVASEDRVTRLRLFSVSAGWCSELHRRLAGAIGDENVRVESAPGPG